MAVRTLALVLLAVVSVTAAHAKVYTWIDENGVLHYSDKPVKGVQAKRVATEAGNVVPRLNDGVMHTAAPPRKATGFEVAIKSPANEATVRDNQGILNIVGSVSPTPKGSGYSYRLRMDGRVLGDASDEPNFDLMNVNRGAHKLKIEMLDKTGKVIASSPVKIVYLHRQSVNNAR